MSIQERLFYLAMKEIDRIESDGQVSPCPDEDLLTAFVEGRLSGKAREDVEAHIAGCPRCRRVAAQGMKLIGENGGAAVEARRSFRYVRWAAAAAVVLVLAGILIYAAAHLGRGGVPVVLVTEEEAMLPSVRGFVPEVEGGPIVEVVTPKEGKPVSPPFELRIVITPGATGLPPDMDTLKVEYIGLENVDITERFREHIRDNEILIENAVLPPGRHVLSIEIRDTGGNRSVRVVGFEVE